MRTRDYGGEQALFPISTTFTVSISSYLTLRMVKVQSEIT